MRTKTRLLSVALAACADVELPAPPDPIDPRDHCVLLNRCVMRASSGGLEWRGRVDGGVLVRIDEPLASRTYRLGREP